jgi:ABC-type Fe3+-hydroxamate transport system substrate-binding protein
MIDQRGLLPAAAILLLANAASAYPVTVASCGHSLTFAEPPTRAVAHDQNISEIMFALELQPQMVGLTGITGWYKMTPEFAAALGDLPELAAKYPTLENLLAVDPDFFFAGWYYGMQPGGEVTPDTLSAYGIPVYVLTESCIHIDKEQPRASLDLLYADVANIGRVFGAEARADVLIETGRRGWPWSRRRLPGGHRCRSSSTIRARTSPSRPASMPCRQRSSRPRAGATSWTTSRRAGAPSPGRR